MKLIATKSILSALFIMFSVFHAAAQTDVPIPFEEEGFLYDYSDQSVLILDVGKNLLDTSDTLFIKITGSTKFTDKKDKKAINIAELVPGSRVKVFGERSRATATFTATKVQLYEPPKEFEIKGYFERLDKTSSGEIAWVSGQAVKLGPGVVIKGSDEWKGKTFASFNDMMLGSKVEIRVKQDLDRKFVVLGGETKPNLFSFNDNKLKEALKKQTAKYMEGLKLSDSPNAVGKSGLWEFKNNETGQSVEGQISVVKSAEVEVFRVIVDGKEYDLTTLPKYVESVGNKVVPQYMRDLPDSDPGKINFRFFVVQDDTFNAFALPDGTIVVHTGLLKMLRNESQLASVLGHEIAHVTHEHSRRKLEQQNKLAWITFVTAVGTGVNPTVFMNLIKLGFSRQLEDESDRVGLFYTANAGYDPRESPKVWQQVVDLKGKSSETTNFFTSGHSLPEDRLKNLNRELYRHYKDYDYNSTAKEDVRFLINVGTAFGWVKFNEKKASTLTPAQTVNAPKGQKTEPKTPQKKTVKKGKKN